MTGQANDPLSAALERYHLWAARAAESGDTWLLAEAGGARLYAIDVQIIVVELERLRRTGT